MNRDVKVGDMIAVTMIDGDVVNPVEFRTVVEIDLDKSLMLLDSPVEGNNVVEHDTWMYNDDWVIVDETPTHMQYDDEALSHSNRVADKSHRDVKVGDKIEVSRHSGELCQREAIVTEVYDSVFDVQFYGSDEEDVLYKNRTDIDEWDYASEDYVQQREEETLQRRQTHAYYDDDADIPTYSQFLESGRGRTLADYTGVNITEDSLDFESKEEEALRGITAESLNFEEAPKSDAVNHPSHYNYGDIEVIDFIEQVTEQYEDGFDAYIVGNALKYLARSPHKNGLEDVKKAVWYLERLIKRNEDE